MTELFRRLSKVVEVKSSNREDRVGKIDIAKSKRKIEIKEKADLEIVRTEFRSVLLPIFQDVARVNGLHVSGKYKPFVFDWYGDHYDKGDRPQNVRGKSDGPLIVTEICNNQYNRFDRSIKGELTWANGSSHSGSYRSGSFHEWGNRFVMEMVSGSKVSFDGKLFTASDPSLLDSIVNFFDQNKQHYDMTTDSPQM